MMVYRYVNALTMFGGNLYVGGDFKVAGGHATRGSLLRCKTKTWDPILLTPNVTIYPKVYVLAATDKALYIGGNFQLS